MKRLKFLMMVCAVAGGGLFTSCSSDSDPVIETGNGGISLVLNAENSFRATKAVTEFDYTDADKYTVQIIKDGETNPVVSGTYSTLASQIASDGKIPLSDGAYVLKAFYGEDKAASTSSMYVYGEKEFNINNDTVNVEVTCKPTCAKVLVNFDSTMATYFSSYSVTFSTEALDETDYTWKQDQTDPVYLKVNKSESVKYVINLVRKDSGKSSTVDKKYTLSPQDFLTLNIKPVVNSGNVGISIDIDESTNDKPIDIIIPADWK